MPLNIYIMYVPSEPTLFQKFTDAGAWAWTNGVHSICMNTFIGLLMSATTTATAVSQHPGSVERVWPHRNVFVYVCLS